MNEKMDITNFLLNLFDGFRYNYEITEGYVGDTACYVITFTSEHAFLAFESFYNGFIGSDMESYWDESWYENDFNSCVLLISPDTWKAFVVGYVSGDDAK
jgi:hypothetical protein